MLSGACARQSPPPNAPIGQRIQRLQDAGGRSFGGVETQTIGKKRKNPTEPKRVRFARIETEGRPEPGTGLARSLRGGGWVSKSPSKHDNSAPQWAPVRVRKKDDGGWGGIRTHGRLSPTPVFKTGALNRSATHPASALCAMARNLARVFADGGAKFTSGGQGQMLRNVKCLQQGDATSESGTLVGIIYRLLTNTLAS